MIIEEKVIVKEIPIEVVVEKVVEKEVIKEVEKKAAYNEKQKEWYKWRKRAEKVGVAPLKGRRPTPAQRKTWERAIIKAEGELDGRENG